ncbi:MAG: hypothetical protein AAF927_17255 [Bacteroidota bacterium]
MELPADIPSLPPSEKLGTSDDLVCLYQEAWLKNTEVKPFILPLRSQWHVFMVFFSLEPEIKLIVRRIAAYPSEIKAVQFAKIFQRGIRKDARGTLKRNSYAYHICDN